MSKIELKKISVENFMGCGVTEYTFKGHEDLILVLGIIADSTSTASNGASKSTFFIEAPVWCLYDKTLRGLSVDDVLHEDVGKDCLVVLEGTKNGTPFIIKRFRNYSKLGGTGATLEIQGEDLSDRKAEDYNKRIADFIGVSFEDFTAKILFSGFSQKFSTMTDGVRKTTLETLLKLDRWTNHRAKYDAMAKRYKNSIELLKEKSIRLERELADKKLKVDQANTNYNNYEIDKTQNIETYKQKLIELQIKQKKVGDREKIEAVLFEKRNEEQKQILDTTNNITKLNNDKFTEDKKLIDLNSKISSNKRMKDSLDVKEVCPTCQQKLDVAKVNKIKKQAQDLQDEMDKFEKQKEPITLQIDGIKKAIEVEQKKQNDIKGLFKPAYEALNTALMLTINLGNEIVQLTNKIQGLVENVNPYQELIRSLDADLIQLGRGLEVCTWLINLKTKVYDTYYKFWERGFSPKGIKSFIIQSVLPYLNDRCKQYSQLLTNNEFEIYFSGQRKLKSGAMSEELDFVAKALRGGNNYKKLSTGERKRVDLILQFALDDVRQLNNATELNVRFYDEVFDGVDSTGHELILKTLRVINKGKESYIMSHDDKLKDMINAIVIVKKIGRFSEIVN